MPSSPYTADSRMPDNSPAQQALDNVMGSQAFSDMPRLKRFLEYIVTETIAGNGDRLKGVVIACDVFDKIDPDEAQSTTIVRVEAGRLRRRLSEYYRGEGKNDPVRIRIPKGGYVAVFDEMAEDSTGLKAPSGKAGPGREWSTQFKASMEAITVSWFGRWNQGNFFRYMSQSFDPDRLIDYQLDAIPDPTAVVNPAWRQLDGEVRRELARLSRKWPNSLA